MICYRDRTFCSEKDCQNVRCSRLITEEVREGARALGLGICIGNLKREGCGYIPPSVESEPEPEEGGDVR